MKIFFAVKLALLPFAVFWALLAAHHPDWAIWLGLALAFAGTLWRALRSEVAVLEVSGLALFAAMALAQDIAPDWMAVNALWLSFAGLGGVSIGSLVAGHPWTADESRAAQ